MAEGEAAEKCSQALAVPAAQEAVRDIQQQIMQSSSLGALELRSAFTFGSEGKPECVGYGLAVGESLTVLIRTDSQRTLQQ
jgi:hypothetical protein